MAFDTYGRPTQRGNGEPSYFEPSDAASDYMSHHYSTEPRDYHPSMSSRPRQPTSLPINDRMTSAADRSDPAGQDGVSPELIAAITDKVKKERKFQHARLRAFPKLTRLISP